MSPYKTNASIYDKNGKNCNANSFFLFLFFLFGKQMYSPFADLMKLAQRLRWAFLINERRVRERERKKGIQSGAASEM